MLDAAAQVTARGPVCSDPAPLDPLSGGRHLTQPGRHTQRVDGSNVSVLQLMRRTANLDVQAQERNLSGSFNLAGHTAARRECEGHSHSCETISIDLRLYRNIMCVFYGHNGDPSVY